MVAQAKWEKGKEGKVEIKNKRTGNTNIVCASDETDSSLNKMGHIASHKVNLHYRHASLGYAVSLVIRPFWASFQ